VFRDFPLENHRQAGKAAEAAHCAGLQGKFWEYHDRLFANQSRLEVPALKEHAADLGLDTGAFNACLDEGRFTAAVAQDLKEGMAEGVSATPTFFINGRIISGAQPFEAFKTVIDEELARAAK
jgi:protein-disulfide isomerase